MTILDSHQLELKRSVDGLRLELSALRLSFLLTRHGYDPNQPRVPSGNPDGGQWTDTGGSSSGSGSGSSIGSNLGSGQSSGQSSGIGFGGGTGTSIGTLFDDVNREEVAGQKKPLEPANSASTLNLESYRLQDDEGKRTGRGRSRTHTIARHVGKSTKYLIARVRAKQQPLAIALAFLKIGKLARRFTKVKLYEASSFTSLAAANRMVRSTLSRNEHIVRLVSSGEFDGRKTISTRFASKTGKVAFARGFRSPKIYSTYGVKVVIYYDPDSPNGFRVLTAFPVR